MRRIRISLIYVAGLLLILVVAAFALRAANVYPLYVRATELPLKRQNNPYNQRLVDSGVGMLRTGDLVIRMGADMTSYMFSQMNQTDKTYSHCGLVVVEDGVPFVYHAIGGEDNPDQILRKDSASFWFSPANNLGFGIARLALDSSGVGALTSVIHRMYREKRKFDMDFDLRTDDRLYCAEFVYKALNQATRNSAFIKPVTVLGYTFVGVDNLFLSPHAKLVCQLRFK